MICQECQKEQATVHMMKYINGQTVERHLCEACARKEGMSFGNDFLNPFGTFSVNNLLSGLMEAGLSTEGGPKRTEASQDRCPQCGQSYMHFHRSGRLGCAGCYQAFHARLQPLLRQVHGATVHRGKVPLRSGKAVQLRRRVDDLKAQMQKAIEAEQFEAAAQLRDEIRSLEQEKGV